METETQPPAATFPPLKVALCGEGDAAFSWWTPMLLQSPAFKVVAVWSRHKAEALRLYAAVTRHPGADAAGAGGTAAARPGGRTADTEAASATAANGAAPGEGAEAATREEERGQRRATTMPGRTAATATGAAPGGPAIEKRGGGEGDGAAADVEVYWEEAGNLSDVCSRSSKRASCKNFLTLLLQHSGRVDGFVLVLPPDSHAATVEQVLSLLPDKHIFSATPPSLYSPTMKNLVCLYAVNKDMKMAEQRLLEAAATQKTLGTNNGSNSRGKNSSRTSSSRGGNSSSRTIGSAGKTYNSNKACSRRRRGLWNVCCPFRNEVAVTKLQALMKDLGKLVTAELLASATVQTVAYTYTGALPPKHLQTSQQQQQAYLLAVCCAYSSLLRLLLGDIVSLSSVQGYSSTVSGQLQFHGGVSCAITADLCSKVTLFSLTVWGVKGFGKLCWNHERSAFEIQRYLHHYEHPTLHPVTGPLWGVKAWVENIWRQEERRGRGLRLVAEGDCMEGGREGPDERTEKADEEEREEAEESVQSPERYLVDLLTACALMDASGAVVQLR